MIESSDFLYWTYAQWPVTSCAVKTMKKFLTMSCSYRFKFGPGEHGIFLNKKVSFFKGIFSTKYKMQKVQNLRKSSCEHCGGM
jgi:hypothetical protein